MPADVSANELLTFGHGPAGRAELGALLRPFGIAAVWDVRTAPGSRRNPDVLKARLAEWLPADLGVAYHWEPDLGGFRDVPPDSPDVVWRNASFRAYAGYTRTTEFLRGVDRLLAAAAEARTAVMCSESVWWRCHRRIIADFAVLAREVPVRHLMHDGRLTPHSPTPGVRLRGDGLLVYDDTAAAAAAGR